MTTKPGLLQNIRQQIADRQNSGQGPAPKCPLCQKDVTIEETNFFRAEVCEHCLEHVLITDLTACCSQENNIRVKFITSGGTIQVREQCQSCGNVKPNSIGGVDKPTRESLPEINIVARDQRNRNYSAMYTGFYKRVNERRQLQRKSRSEEIKDSWFSDYNKYLASKEWQAKRDKVLKRDNYRCQCCLDSYATQVHHKNYEFEDMSGKVPAFDLISVCGPCHDWIEKKKQERRESDNQQNLQNG